VFNPYKVLDWYSQREGRIILVAIIIPFIIVTIWGTYPNYQFNKKTEELSKYFQKENLTFIISHSSGNGVFIKLNYSDGNPERTNNNQIKESYKAFIIEKICNYPHYIKKLENGRYISIDLIDKDNFKPFFNLNVKAGECGI